MSQPAIISRGGDRSLPSLRRRPEPGGRGDGGRFASRLIRDLRQRASSSTDSSSTNTVEGPEYGALSMSTLLLLPGHGWSETGTYPRESEKRVGWLSCARNSTSSGGATDIALGAPYPAEHQRCCCQESPATKAGLLDTWTRCRMLQEMLTRIPQSPCLWHRVKNPPYGILTPCTTKHRWSTD